ncbi:MAG: PLP-dependent transferase [Caldilineaceae bacterium]
MAQQHNANGLAKIFASSKIIPKCAGSGIRGWRAIPTTHRHKATMAGYGGVVSFEIEGDGALAHRFIDALKIPHIGPSLGGVETMVSPLATRVTPNCPRRNGWPSHPR